MSAPLDTELDGPGFEADGRPVPTVEADVYFDDPAPEDAPEAAHVPRFGLDETLDLLLIGAKNSDEIARRVLILAMLQKRPNAPKSLAQFALWLNMPRTTARRKWTGILQHLRACYTELRPPARHP